MAADFTELRTLANANERMVELFRWLDSQDKVVNAKRGMDIRVYSDSIAVEHFVEGELVGGHGICYWLETRLRENVGSVSGNVFLQARDGQRTLRELCVDIKTEAELPGALATILEDLWRVRDEELQRAISMS